MWKIFLRITSGIIAFLIFSIILINLYIKTGDIKADGYFEFVSITLVFVAWAILFALVAFRKYPGDLVSFLAWLLVFPMTMDFVSRFYKHGTAYFQTGIVGAYLVLFITLIAIAWPRHRIWRLQALLLLLGTAVCAGAVQWIDMSDTLRDQLAALDSRIKYVHERLEGANCYVPLRDMTPGMVKAKLAKLDNMLKITRTYLPDKPPIKKFKQSIYAQAKLNGLQVTAFAFQGTRELNFYSESLFEGKVVGSRRQYLKFKSAIENMPWLVSWSEDKRTGTDYRFSGRLFAYRTEREIATSHHLDITAINKKHAQTFRGTGCVIDTHNHYWWPPYAERLDKKRNEYKAMCLKLLPFENILVLERKMRREGREVFDRLSIIQHLAKSTDNQFIKTYKPNPPTSCSK